MLFLSLFAGAAASFAFAPTPALCRRAVLSLLHLHHLISPVPSFSNRFTPLFPLPALVRLLFALICLSQDSMLTSRKLSATSSSHAISAKEMFPLGIDRRPPMSTPRSRNCYRSSRTPPSSTKLGSLSLKVVIFFRMMIRATSRYLFILSYSFPHPPLFFYFSVNAANTSRAMFRVRQVELLTNRWRTMVLSSPISKASKDSFDFQWSPFPMEMNGASAVVPSPSGSKLLAVRNKENDSQTVLEIWGQALLEKKFMFPNEFMV